MSKPLNITAALDIVANDSYSRRLISTWPLVHAPAEATVETVAEWSRVSSVHVSIVQDRATTLFEAGICQDGGTVPAEVLAAIRQLAVGKIRRDSGLSRGPRAAKTDE